MEYINSGYEEGYRRGYAAGRLMGAASFYIKITWILYDETIREALIDYFSEDEWKYLKEVDAIKRKYPHYSEEHIEKKVIYESTYLPIFLHESEGGNTHD